MITLNRISNVSYRNTTPLRQQPFFLGRKNKIKILETQIMAIVKSNGVAKQSSEDNLIELAKDWLKLMLNKNKYKHSKRVTENAIYVNNIMNEDKSSIILAAILHDCAKKLSSKKMLKIAKKNKLKISKKSLKSPRTLHAKLSAIIAKKRLGIKDKKVLSGIKHHRRYKEKYSTADKIIFLADKIDKSTVPREEILAHLKSTRDIDETIKYYLDIFV